jgi:hypothetical protein
MTHMAPATTRSFASRRKNYASNATGRRLRTARAPPQSRNIPITKVELRGAAAWIATCRQSRPKEFQAHTFTRTRSGLSRQPQPTNTESQILARRVTPTSQRRGLLVFSKDGPSVPPGAFNRHSLNPAPLPAREGSGSRLTRRARPDAPRWSSLKRRAHERARRNRRRRILRRRVL